MLGIFNHVEICFMDGWLTLSLLASNWPFGDRSQNLAMVISEFYLKRNLVFWRFLNRFGHFSCFSILGFIKTLNFSKYLPYFTLFLFVWSILKVKLLFIKIFAIIWVIKFLLFFYVGNWNFSNVFPQSEFFHWRRKGDLISFFYGLIGWLFFMTFNLNLVICVSVDFLLSTFYPIIFLSF